MNNIAVDSLTIYALLLTLFIVLTVLVPALIVGWVRGRRARAQDRQERERYWGRCPVCLHTAGVHDRTRHQARGIPINGPTMNLGGNPRHGH